MRANSACPAGISHASSPPSARTELAPSPARRRWPSVPHPDAPCRRGWQPDSCHGTCNRRASGQILDLHFGSRAVEFMPKLTPINGSCHCGNIAFILQWPNADTEVPVRRCGCTFCRKHAGAWTSQRNSELSINVLDMSLVSKYGFGTKTADFYVCSVCGVVPIVLSTIDGRQYAVVNVNTLSLAEGFSFSSTSTNFDGEDAGSRLERRKNNWIPTVVVGSSAA